MNQIRCSIERGWISLQENSKLLARKSYTDFPLPFDCIYSDKREYEKISLEQMGGSFSTVHIISVFWILIYRYCYKTSFPISILRNQQLVRFYPEYQKDFRHYLQDVDEKYKNFLPLDHYSENKSEVLFTINYEFSNLDSKFDDAVLVLNINENNGHVTECELIYHKILFKRDTMERLRSNFYYLLSQTIESDTKGIDQYKIVTTEEVTLLKGFNRKEKDWNYHETYMEVFYKNIKNFYGKDAIVQGDLKISYERLNDISNYYAALLAEKEGKYVGIYADSDAETEIGILSILKAGRTIVTINPTYPPDRIKFIVRALEINVIVTNREMSQSQLDSSIIKNIILIDPNIQIGKKHQDIYCPVDVQDECYVIFTSGTTGEPKGVKITQENIMIEINFFRDYFNLDSSLKALHILNYSFDFGLYDILSPFLFGGTLYSVDKKHMKGFKDYISIINEEKINFINTTPSFFNILTGMKTMLYTLKHIHLGGEKVTYPMIQNYIKIVTKECEIYNGYGPCECTVGSNIYKIPYEEKYGAKNNLTSVPIGSPTDNSEVFVLDDNLRYVPINALGELCIAGESLGKGYIDQKKNEGKFITFEGKKIYKTGDLVRWLSSGDIEFIGRIDNQVKINGFRIELSEIDVVLIKHRNIAEAKTVCLDNGGSKVIISFIKLKEDMQISDVKKHVMQYLPYYMIPGKIIIINDFPYLESGKVDIKKLTSLC